MTNTLTPKYNSPATQPKVPTSERKSSPTSKEPPLFVQTNPIYIATETAEE